jgi:hypothetical protein
LELTLEVSFPVLNFPSSGEAPDGIFVFISLISCGLIIAAWSRPRSLCSQSAYGNAVHAVCPRATATGTPCEKSREEAPIGIRFSARAVTKNAFRFVKVRLVLAHKKHLVKGAIQLFLVE